MNPLTFGFRDPFLFQAPDLPELTFSPTSGQSEAGDSVATDAGHSSTAPDVYVIVPHGEPVAPALQAGTGAGLDGLMPCRLRADTGAGAHSPEPGAPECWTLGALPWGHEAPSKIKCLPPPCAHIDAPEGTRFSLMTDNLGRRYIMGPRIGAGSSGKLKFFLPVASPEENWCVKELRLPQPGILALGKKTFETSLDHMAFEYTLSQYYGGPLAAQHIFTLRQRGFLLFPMARGSLLQMLSVAPPVCRSLMARAAGSCVAQTLAQMHNDGWVHLDIKEDNILALWEPPYFALADFGSAAFVDPRRRHSARGYQSTYCAPEALRRDGFVADKTDLWSLGVTLLASLEEPPHFAPISYFATPGGSVDVQRSRLAIADLQREAHSYLEGPPPSDNEAATHEGDKEGYSPFMRDWLLACHSIDGPLTHLVAQTLLVPHETRASAAEFLHHMLQLAPVLGIDNPKEALDHCMAAPVGLTHTPAFQALHQVRLSAHRSQHTLFEPDAIWGAGAVSP